MSPPYFLKQKYSIAIWDQLEGLRPFIVTGPAFQRFLLQPPREKFWEYRFTPQFKAALVRGFPTGQDWRREIAEFLLSERIVVAMWSVDRSSLPPEAERWDRSILQAAREIPSGRDSVAETIEFLSGLGGPEHYTNLLGGYGLRLESLIPPSLDGLSIP